MSKKEQQELPVLVMGDSGAELEPTPVYYCGKIFCVTLMPMKEKEGSGKNHYSVTHKFSGQFVASTGWKSLAKKVAILLEEFLSTRPSELEEMLKEVPETEELAETRIAVSFLVSELVSIKKAKEFRYNIEQLNALVMKTIIEEEAKIALENVIDE